MSAAEAEMRVTLVAHEVGTPGGMERQLAELAGGLLDRGYEVTVVARSCKLSRHPRLRVVRVRGPRRPFSLWYLWFFALGTLAVRRHRVGLVHTTGAIVLNRAELSTVHFCHRAFRARAGVGRASRRSMGYRLNAWLVGVMSRLAERCCYRPRITRRLVSVSEGVSRELGQFFPAAEVSVIPNGVDREAFAPDAAGREEMRASLGLDDGELVSLFVGGDWERKGLRHAVEGVARAGRWHLVVVGEGDLERYRALARDAGAAERVHFRGSSPDPAPYYAAADGFLLPTVYEAGPLVTFEAAASGLPLLVSRVSGVEDILVDDRNGWFIDRDGEMIASRLQALEDERLRHAMGAAARQDSARFTWERAVEAYDRLYRELMAP